MVSSVIVFPLFFVGTGVLLWWWPDAIFVAFSAEDVTPGARLFTGLFVYFGTFLGNLMVDGVPGGFVGAFGTTLAIVGVLQIANPVMVFGPWREDGWPPRSLGVLFVLAGLLVLGFLRVGA